MGFSINVIRFFHLKRLLKQKSLFTQAVSQISEHFNFWISKRKHNYNQLLKQKKTLRSLLAQISLSFHGVFNFFFSKPQL